jgi:hypothetical protein
MSESTYPFDDRTIDRLVDGELAPEERRRLLAALEAAPGGWRRCALAFLEAQAWSGEMKRLVREPAPVDARATLAAPRGGAPGRKGYAWAGWLAAAAAVVVAFGVGREFRPASPAPAVDGGLAAVEPAPMRQAPGAGDADAVTLVVNDLEGKPQRIAVPLVEGRRLGAEFAESPEWSNSPELARRLEQQGLGLAARRRYAPLYFEQRDQVVPLIVPVDDAYVRPVSRPVF